MALTRSEAGALAIAGLGHLALLLAIGAAQAPNPSKLEPQPIEVTLSPESDVVALESQAPVPSSEEAAAKLSPVEAPPEPEVAPPQPAPDPQPIAKPQPPAPRPAPDAKPAPKQPPTRPAPAAAPAKQPPRRDVRASGALDGIVEGLKSQPSKGKATTPPAASVGPAVTAALAAEVLRQVKPKWTPPTGADSEKLRTTVRVSLARDGSIVGEPRVSQTGITDSNRAQAALHRERAIRAVRLAAPFKLPPQFYDAWKTIEPTLYEGL
jgi:outer membrane biosynthesis protein TonB